MEKYLMGIDAGNTSSKVVIFDLYGKMIATAATPSMHFKRRGEGFEEFDVTELWNLISVCIKEAVEKAAVAPEQIAGVGVTSFGNGVVFLDKEGYAIAPGCFSQDYRANSIIEMYQREGTYEKINDIVKGTLFAGEPGPILRWYKENYREIYDQIGGILQFKDYIMYRLTNVFATDLNCFGGAFMVDMNTMDYSRELMDLYGIPELYGCIAKTCDRADRNCWNSNKRSVRNYRTRRRNSCCSRNDGYTSMPGWCGSNGRGGIYCRCRFLVYQ